MNAMSTNYTLLCWRGMSYVYVVVHLSQVGEVKYVQFIPQLAKSLLIKWLCEDVGWLIFGANAFNANITLLLMISYEMVPYVNVLGS